MIPDDIKEKIDQGNWTFTDKLLKGGFGYGKLCIPDELPHIVLAIVFPPFSILWNYNIGIYTLWETIKKIFNLLYVNDDFLLSRINICY